MNKKLVILSISGLFCITHGNALHRAPATKFIKGIEGTFLHRPSVADTNKIIKIVYPPVTEREGKGLNLPLPPAEHPRLYLTKKDIPALKLKLNAGMFSQYRDRLMKNTAIITDGILMSDDFKNGNDIKIRDAIEAKALMSILNNDKTLARKAINALINFYATLKPDPSKPDVTRDFGRFIVTGSIVYDWCYTELTNSEKQLLISRMETLAAQMEIKWPELVQGSVVGHGVEAQLSRDLLSFGIAVYNEKPIVYNLVAGRIIAEFLPARNLFYPAGYHHQGSSYGPYRFAWDMFATLVFDKMGYPRIFGNDQGKVPYFWLYARRPDGQLMRNGDEFMEFSNAFGKRWPINGIAYTGSYFKDPVFINEALKEGKPGKGADYLFDLLFLNADAPANRTVSSLPLTKYFKEPLGAMIARTGWDEGMGSSAAVAEMKIGVKTFANHEHLDAGSFQIYYKGPLAVQSGIYQGVNGGYGSDHFINYSQRSVAHNTMLFYDASEQFYFNIKTIANDGGQKYPNKGQEPQNAADLSNKEYNIGEVLAHSFGPDSLKPEFSYLKGQLAPAYSKKVKSFTRSFIFLNLNNPDVPAALIVFDDVKTISKDIKKYWLLHCVEEPAIRDSVTTITRNQKGYDGKMVVTTLLPSKQNLIINKIGGAGNEFNVFGKQYPQAFKMPDHIAADSAMWRIEVSPKKADTANLFLNVMQLIGAHAKSAQLLPVTKVETNKLVGAQIGNRIVTFSKSGRLIADNFNLSVKGKGTFKVLLTDLKAGNWSVHNTRTGYNISIKNDKQQIYVTLQPGEYKVLPKS